MTCDACSAPPCAADGDHLWHGTSQCVWCGERLRCACGAYVREDNTAHWSGECPVLKKVGTNA